MRTQDLTDLVLDWAVANAEGYVLTSDGISNLLVRENETLLLGPGSSPLNYSPICYWMQGGEIIEREMLCVGYRHQADPNYCPINDPATICWARTTAGGYLSYGPTPLIAAMRCFCASRLGDEVEIPKELMT